MTKGDFNLYNPRPYKSTNFNDPMKMKEFKPSNQPLNYKSYKPSHVGIYGEKTKAKIPRPATPPKPDKPTMLRKPTTTFQSYSRPSGPDIQTNNMGPEYKIREHDYKEYKPHDMPPNKYKDAIQRNPHVNYMDRKPEDYKGKSGYKLNEQNNLGMRHWKSTFVEDTISAKADSKDKTRPEKRYIVPEKAKKEQTKKEKPIKPVTPDRKIKNTKTPIPVPVVVPVQLKKKFVTSSTQHEAPRQKAMQTQTQTGNAKTLGTQYERTKTKTFGTQSESTNMTSTNMQTDTPVPDIIAAPIVAPVTTSRPKPASKSAGIQCEEPKKNTVGMATQYNGPKTRVIQTQTTPTPARTPRQRDSPKFERVVPAYMADNRTPSPVRQNTPPYIRQPPTPPPSYSRDTPPYMRQPPTPPPTHWSNTPLYRRDPEIQSRDTPPYMRQTSPPRRAGSPDLAPLVAGPIVTSPRRRTPTPPSPQREKTPSPGDTWVRPPTPERTPTPPYRHQQAPPYSPPYHQTPPLMRVQSPSTGSGAPSTARRSEADSRWTPEPEQQTHTPRDTVDPHPTPPKQYQAPAISEPPSRHPAPRAGPIGITPQNWNQWPPQAPKNKLPPEINFCIEAYNSAHTSNVRETAHTGLNI